MFTKAEHSVLQVLSAEDSPSDAALIERELKKLGSRIVFRRVDTRDRLLEEFGRLKPDLVLSDYSMPGFSGPHALKLIRERDPEVPFIFVSGHVKEDWVAEAIQVGATDFVDKDRLSRLAPVVRRALREVAERDARRRSLEALRVNEERLRLLIDHCPGALALFDRDMRYLMVSPRWVQDYGLQGRELIGRSHYEIFPDLPERWKEIHRRCLAGASERCEEDPFPRASGKLDWVRWEIHPWRDPAGGIGGILMFTEVITDRKRLEDQLRQAQRMEVIGRLAGGVAHDFNNLLTPILGYADLLVTGTQPGSRHYEELSEIRKSAQRAATLTRQLLAFSRKQVLQPKVVDLNALVTDIQKLLIRVIGEDVRLSLELEPGLAPVKVDPGQIEQVVMNLAINSRDAMPRGGTLTIKTAHAELDEAYAAEHPDAKPGTYVCLAVGDTGTGMDRETLSHLFEPFFTTKPPGKGTGLGLATVYGIVRQSNGHVSASSEPGRGSTFKVYLPRAEEKPDAGKSEAKPTPPGGGAEVLLVVEDDATLRTFVTRALRMKGYQVLEAGSGEEAIAVAEGHGGTLDLLLTDVVMPGLSGRDASLKIQAGRPKMKVVYMSGYTGDIMVHHGVLDEGVALLEKPFTMDALLRKVREVLG